MTSCYFSLTLAWPPNLYRKVCEYYAQTCPHSGQYIYIWARSPDPHTPPPSPPNGTPPPLLTPPTPPQNLVFACYLHIYIHIYTYILPFPPLQPRISTLFAALESHDLVNGPCLPVYFYHNLFFRTAYSVPRTWFTTYLLPMDYAKLTYANLDICTVEKQ